MEKYLKSHLRKKVVIVCDNCLRASCFDGIFMCEKSKSAGTTQKTIEDLIRLKKEHPSYFGVDS